MVPLPKLLVKYCARRCISISQLTHATVRNILAILTLAAEGGGDVDCDSFKEMSHIKRNLNLSRRFYVSMKSSTTC